MKIIVIGDTHGSRKWTHIAESFKEDADKIVFMGDYFDSHEGISGMTQLSNFDKILALKREMPEKIVLLVGNHDYHYLGDFMRTYSGFQTKYAADIRRSLVGAISEGLMQMSVFLEGCLFTHAGLTKTWAGNNGVPVDTGEAASLKINELFRDRPEVFEFTSGNNKSISGDDVAQTPIWVRPVSLTSDRPRGFSQVVGHTRMVFGPPKSPILFTDTLGTRGTFFIMHSDDKGKVTSIDEHAI